MFLDVIDFSEAPDPRIVRSQGIYGVLAEPELDGQLLAEHCDLDVLFVRRRTEPDQVEQAADEQEGDLTSHPDDPGRCASPLLTHQILSLHPTASFETRNGMSSSSTLGATIAVPRVLRANGEP